MYGSEGGGWFFICTEEDCQSLSKADAPIRTQTDKQFVTDPLKPTVEIPRGKRGSAINVDYDKAYENIKTGLSLREAYGVFKQTVKYADKTLWDNFRRAMNRRTKKDNHYNWT